MFELCGKDFLELRQWILGLPNKKEIVSSAWGIFSALFHGLNPWLIAKSLNVTAGTFSNDRTPRENIVSVGAVAFRSG